MLGQEAQGLGLTYEKTASCPVRTSLENRTKRGGSGRPQLHKIYLPNPGRIRQDRLLSHLEHTGMGWDSGDETAYLPMKQRR